MVQCGILFGNGCDRLGRWRGGHGIKFTRAQGDSAIADILAEFGAEVTKDENKGAVRVKKKNLHAIKIDASANP